MRSFLFAGVVLQLILIGSIGFAQNAGALGPSSAIQCRDVFMHGAPAVVAGGPQVSGSAQTADQVFRGVMTHTLRVENNIPTPPVVLTAAGSTAPILRPFEKEGLLYQDIASWFNVLKDKGSNSDKGYVPRGKEKLVLRFQKELKDPALADRKTSLTYWLKYLWLDVEVAPGQKFNKLKPQQKLDYLVSLANAFSVIPVNKAALLFENSILNFDDIAAGPNAPYGIVVGDDLGSYEARSGKPIVDRTESLQSRKALEDYLEGKVGHQHEIHGWPANQADRERIQGQYIEALDTTTWMLFWRQMKRDPEETDSILFHPYLGVYTRSSLEKLAKAFVSGDAKGFNDKYRMVGARSFKADPSVPGQGTGYVPDWELRSGSKGPLRGFTEAMVEARLVSGDYSGLKDFRSYQFDPSAPIEELAGKFVSKADILILKKFEEQLTEMNYSADPRAKNQFRNKVLSPLLPWGNRLALEHKRDDLLAAQQVFADDLVSIARDYLKEFKQGKKDVTTKIEIRQETKDELEELVFAFAEEMRLDRDLQTYLIPPPRTLPTITVPNTGNIVDVNQIPLGVEYSLRFDRAAKPTTKADAEKKISAFAESFSESIGATDLAPMDEGGHGHSAVVKYGLKDPNGQKWRVEWDGVQRSYRLGKVHQAWGGHVEIPTPRMTPQDMTGTISKIFSTGRQFNMLPGRYAGGAHFNVDLATLKALPTEVGTRAFLNLMSYFESNRDVITFLWQNPLRMHAAYPVPLKAGFGQDVASFHGDWDNLGRFLYNERYFNTFVGRKPKYSQWNMTPLMTPFIPREYIENRLDIRNKDQQWFPNFNNVTGRFEARFMDAPKDEYMAALQFKWFRAFLNKTLNSPTPLVLARKFTDLDFQNWRQDPQAWIAVVTDHLKDLGLDPQEFEPLYWDSFLQRSRDERVANYVVYDKFLPANQMPVTYDKKAAPAPVIDVTTTQVASAPTAAATVAPAVSKPADKPTSKQDAKTAAKVIVKPVVKTTTKAVKPPPPVDLDEVWRGGSADTFMAFRSNAPHFWAWLKDVFAQKMPAELQQEGLIAGNAHALNFGQVLLKSRKFAVKLIDMDDAGKGPLLGDFLRLSISIKESGASLSYKDIWEAYLDGLNGGDGFEEPKFVTNVLDQSNAEFLEEQQEMLTDNIEDGKLDLEAYNLESLKKAPKWLKDSFAEIQAQILARKDGTEVIDGGWKTRDEGGSQGLLRIWLLMKRQGKYRLVEYKQMADPATGNISVQKTNSNRVDAVKNAYWGTDDSSEYSVTSTSRADFLTRSRFEYPLKGKIKEILDAKDKRLDKYSLYLAYNLGQIHGQQPSGKKLADTLSNSGDVAQNMLKKIANEYREILEQNQQ